MREGLPNTLLEAMACGVTVISSQLPDITDWVIDDGIDGFLYSPGNIDELNMLLKKILADENLRKKIGFNARQTIISRFDILFTAKKISSLYKKLSINES